LILGILFFRREQQVHPGSFHGWLLLYERHILHTLFHPADQTVADFPVFHLASAKNDRKPDFIAFCEELAHMLDLDFQVMVPDFGADPKLFDLAALVLLPGFLHFLFALITELRKIRQFADWRVVLSSDFYQV